jgi:hypothetical protein
MGQSFPSPPNMPDRGQFDYEKTQTETLPTPAQTQIPYSGMLRLRKRPPADVPTITMDLEDLDQFLTDGTSAKMIGSYLCREVDEVEAKITSLRN